MPNNVVKLLSSIIWVTRIMTAMVNRFPIDRPLTGKHKILLIKKLNIRYNMC